MSDSEREDPEIKWNSFLATGAFDAIEHPEEGYPLGELVTGRDGILYLVKGINSEGNYVLGVDRETTEGDRIVLKEDFRPTSTIGSVLIETGIVRVPQERLISTEAPSNFEGKNANQN